MTATTGTLRPRAGGSGARPRHSPWACSASSRRAGRPACLKWPLHSAAARPPGALLGRGHRVLRCSRAPRGAAAQISMPMRRAVAPPASGPTLECWHFEHPGGRWIPQRTGAGRTRTPITSQTRPGLHRIQSGRGGRSCCSAHRTGPGRIVWAARGATYLLTYCQRCLLVPAAAAHARRVSAAPLP